MSQDQSNFEIEKSEKVHQLYKNLHSVLGDDFKQERFLGWIGQYLRPSRDFHGLDHMLAMSELDKGLTQQSGRHSAGIYSMVAGFFHDEDYPSITEDINPVSKRFIDKYVEVRGDKKFVKELESGDRIGQILHEVCGFSPGQVLSPFAGMNEFYCAAAAAGELKELSKNNPGIDEQFILAIVIAIEASIPFRNPDRMNELYDRLRKTNEKLNLGLSSDQLDEIMIGATHTANKDVSSFLGGLKPEDDGAKPTTHSVIHTIKWGDRLSPEEVPALRMKGLSPDKKPGEYSPRDFLNARVKRAGLYHLVIPGDDEKRTIPNLFFSVKLSDGESYPPNGWVDKANKLAYENNLPVRTAEYARLISSGLVNAFATIAANHPEKIKVRDLVAKVPELIGDVNLPPDASKVRRLAFECLTGREPSGHDTPRSAIAQYILSKLDEKQMEELGKASRDLLMAGDLTPPQRDNLKDNFPDIYEEGQSKEKMFIKLATKYLGQSVEKIRDDVARSAESGENMKALAAQIKKIKIPKEIGVQ